MYWRYWGSRGGDRPSAPPPARAAWIYRNCTSLPRLVGDACHQGSHRLLKAIRDGRPRPSYDDLLRDGRALLNRVWRTSQPDRLRDFHRWPSDHPALHEVVVRGELPPEEIEQARVLLASCLRHLVTAPLLRDVAEARPTEVLVGGTHPERFSVAPGLPAYAVVDLAYRHQDPGTLGPLRRLVSGPCWCMTDLKSGRPEPAAEWLQIAAYHLWLEAVGCRPTDDVYLGRIVYLRGGVERWIALTPADLARARAVIEADVEAERAMLAAGMAAMRDSAEPPDLARVALVAQEAFPLAQDRRRCPSCDFFLLCRDHLVADGSADALAPPPAAPGGAET